MDAHWLELTDTSTIRRPPSVVRSQFADIQHHADHEVHKALRYEPLGTRDGRQRARTTLNLFGARLVDEIELYVDAQGDVVQDFVAGRNVGGRITVHVDEVSPGVSRVTTHVRLPLRGPDRLLRPLIAWAFRRVLAR